jgi:hypothetical protein
MTPAEAARLVRATLDGNSSGDRGTKALVSLMSSVSLPEFLASIRDSAQIVSHSAPMSHRHPLGFDKIMLLDASPAFLLRLHTWWPGDHYGVEHIHNHRYEVASAVIRGCYDMQVFEEAAGGVHMTEYYERSTPDDDEWVMKAHRNVRLRPTISVRIGQGSGYTLTADALHRVTVPQEELCITLFLALPGVAGVAPGTRIFALPDVTARGLRVKHTYTADEYQRQLDKVIALLSRLPNEFRVPAILHHGYKHPGQGNRKYYRMPPIPPAGQAGAA